MTIYKPNSLNNFFNPKELIKVKVSKLYVGYVFTNKVNYINVKNTIHYKYAVEEILNLKSGLENKYNDYHKKTGHNTNSISYRKLIRNIKDTGYNSNLFPILVYRSLSRIYPLKRWDVIDGFHRLAILSAMGHEEVEVAVCKYKYKNKLKKIFQKLVYNI